MSEHTFMLVMIISMLYGWMLGRFVANWIIMFISYILFAAVAIFFPIMLLSQQTIYDTTIPLCFVLALSVGTIISIFSPYISVYILKIRDK